MTIASSLPRWYLDISRRQVRSAKHVDTTAHKRFLLCIFIDADDGDMSHLQLLCQIGLFFAFHLLQKFSEGSHMPVGQGKGQEPPLPVLLQKDARAGVKLTVLFGTPPQQSIPRGKELVTQFGLVGFVKVKRFRKILRSAIVEILVAVEAAEAELVDGARPFQGGPIAEQLLLLPLLRLRLEGSRLLVLFLLFLLRLRLRLFGLLLYHLLGLSFPPQVFRRNLVQFHPEVFSCFRRHVVLGKFWSETDSIRFYPMQLYILFCIESNVQQPSSPAKKQC